MKMTSWPRSRNAAASLFSRVNGHHTLGPPITTSEIEPNDRLDGTCSRDDTKSPLVPIEQHRRAFERQRVGHELGHMQRDSGAKAAREQSRPSQRGQCCFHRGEYHCDIQLPLVCFGEPRVGKQYSLECQ